jgi:hypothetical protein
MTDRPLGTSHPDPDRSDDRTRDIRLPPMGDRPAAHVPAAWAGTGAPGDVPAHAHEPPLQEQPVQELPAQAPAGGQPTVLAAPAAPPREAPLTSEAPVVGIPAVGSRLPAADPDPTVVVAPVGRSPEPPPVGEQPTDEMRPTDAPRDHTRPFVPPTGQAVQSAGGYSRPERPVQGGRGAEWQAQPEAGGTRAWTWVLLVLLPLLVIAAAGVLLFLLLGGG